MIFPVSDEIEHNINSELDIAFDAVNAKEEELEHVPVYQIETPISTSLQFIFVPYKLKIFPNILNR
jgi:hypothetical protein